MTAHYTDEESIQRREMRTYHLLRETKKCPNTLRNIVIYLSMYRGEEPFTEFHFIINTISIQKVHIIYDEYKVTNVFLYFENYGTMVINYNKRFYDNHSSDFILIYQLWNKNLTNSRHALSLRLTPLSFPRFNVWPVLYGKFIKLDNKVKRKLLVQNKMDKFARFQFGRPVPYRTRELDGQKPKERGISTHFEGQDDYESLYDKKALIGLLHSKGCSKTYMAYFIHVICSSIEVADSGE
ncbi:hypothetical protein RF11_08724 [Thelohanellus kitauei]|uniref:Uncharacterized protein n=1 Tax=Thelohanellus kitauei TaxID=669202 RepID=A0A0C2J3S2_THEKT|nr:hypothetical protein RF11_08724 [Thelohanellus kitauei]